MKKAIGDLQAVEKQTSESWQRMKWQWNSIQGSWNDAAHDRFDANHMTPLEEHARQFQFSLVTLIEALKNAERDLG